jgi:aminoglycoside 3-N-acetyltransferase
MAVTYQDIQHAIHALDLADQLICIHASLRSFGHVEGGALTVVRAFVDEQCTILVPSFSWSFAVPRPPHQRPTRNGWDYDAYPGPTAGLGRIFTPDTTEIDKEMGAIAATIVAWQGHIRGNHPLCSFTAIGPRARELVFEQAPLDMYAPLVALAQTDGFVLLVGVGLESMTLLHLAEKEVGRTMFRRWANDVQGNPIAVEAGSCSNGFGQFSPYLHPLLRMLRVGQSEWKLFPTRQTLQVAAEAIRANPTVTHCSNPACDRCNDAVAGGPILIEENWA